MTEERDNFKAGCQYDDVVGSATLDNHMPDKQTGSLFEASAGKKVIGWRIGKYDYNGPIRVKVMEADEASINDEGLNPDARIYYREVSVSVDDFIKKFGRAEIVILKRQFKENIGQEFTFVYED